MPGTDRLDQLAAPKLVQVHRDHIRGRLPCTTDDVLDQRDDLGPERGRTTDDAEDGELRRTLRIQCSLTAGDRSEEHTSELQSLMRISYAVFCLKKKKKIAQST